MNTTLILKNFNNCVKEIYITARRTDFDNINLWSQLHKLGLRRYRSPSYKYLNECRMYYDNIDSQNIFFDKYLANVK